MVYQYSGFKNTKNVFYRRYYLFSLNNIFAGRDKPRNHSSTYMNYHCFYIDMYPKILGLEFEKTLISWEKKTKN